MIGIYKITSPTKRIYIGQSIDIKRRFYNYKKIKCQGQPLLYSSLKKYGVETHKFEILCECERHELNERERYYQELYSVIGLNGLNLILTQTKFKKREVFFTMQSELIEKTYIIEKEPKNVNLFSSDGKI